MTAPALAVTADTRPDLRWLPVSALVVDPAYQRQPSGRGKSAIARIAREFSWAKFGALVVSARPDGGYAVIDGQHRAIAAREIGLTDAPCVIVREDVAGEAAAFVGVNRDRIAVTKPQVWLAQVAAGEPEAVRLHQLLTACGVRVEGRDGVELAPLTTRCIRPFYQLMKNPGEVYVEDALDMLATGQPETPGLLTRTTIMAATFAVWRVREAEGDLERLAAVIRDAEFDAIEDKAKEAAKLLRKDAFRVAAGMIVKAYNHGQRTRLSEEF